jgi:hypothetical protein
VFESLIFSQGIQKNRSEGFPFPVSMHHKKEATGSFSKLGRILSELGTRGRGNVVRLLLKHSLDVETSAKYDYAKATFAIQGASVPCLSCVHKSKTCSFAMLSRALARASWGTFPMHDWMTLYVAVRMWAMVRRSCHRLRVCVCGQILKQMQDRQLRQLLLNM